MRKRSKIFFLLTVCSLGALVAPAALLAACGSGSFNFGANPEDGGAVANDGSIVPPLDGGLVPVDANIPADGPPASSDGASSDASAGPTTILAVHASANLFPFRLCFGTPSGILPLPPYPNDPTQPMPETNFPGVPVGGAALLPPIQFEGGEITPYVVSASQLDTDDSTTCDALICAGLPPCLAVSDYAPLPPLTLPLDNAAVVLAVEGCIAPLFAGGAGSVAQCGASFDGGTQNLSAVVSSLATSSTGGALTLQLAQLSPSFAPAAGTSLTYLDPTIDASVPLVTPSFAISPNSVTLPLSDAGVMSAYFVVTSASGPQLAESLASIQFFQAPSSDPTTYFNAHSAYFGAIVGDATDAAAPASLPDGAPNPAFDGHGLHVIAYPETGN